MQTIKLNLIPGSVLPVVNVSQYDTNRQFALQVYDGAATYDLTGKTVEIRGTKPDGNGFAYDATDGVVSVSNNVVTISTTQQMTAVGGHVMTELRITSGQTILGTLNFIIDVENSALSDDTLISDTDIPAIERDFEAALEEAQAAAETATTKAGEASTSATNAAGSATSAAADALKSEGYAVGKQNGTAVQSGSPYYQNNAQYFDTHASEQAYNASQSATAAAADSLEAEGWAVGEQGGTPVGPTSPYYHNNAKYYSEQTDVTSLASMSDVDLTSPTNNQVLKYDAATQKWVNGTGGGGASALDDLTDVDITSAADGDLLQYDATEQKWENSAKIPQKVAGLQKTGCVNILDLSGATSQVIEGVTFTVDPYCTITANGTASGNANLVVVLPDEKRIPVQPGKLKWVGCPDGGSDTTYRMQLNINDTWGYSDFGNGLVLNKTGAIKQIVISVRNGYTANNIVFKPMITPDLTATYADYQPYSMTNIELTEGLKCIFVDISSHFNMIGSASYPAGLVVFAYWIPSIKLAIVRISAGNDALTQFSDVNIGTVDTYLPTGSRADGIPMGVQGGNAGDYSNIKTNGNIVFGNVTGNRDSYYTNFLFFYKTV